MRVNTLYSTKEVVTEVGRRMELRYYLIQDIRSLMTFRHREYLENTGKEQMAWDRLMGSQPTADRITYGIRVVKMEEGQEEQECLPGLSTSMEAVERLLKQMIYGLVTPATAVEVVDDWAFDT